MKNRQSVLLLAITSMVLGACASTSGNPVGARADLLASSGSTVSGSVAFTQTESGVRIEARVAGLKPGEHGFHVHEVGDCSAPDAMSAKGHYNPHGKAHGGHGGEHHVGDMPNLVADASGKAEYSAVLADMRLQGEVGNITGRSVVIHADPDDYKSQPAGNSGKRIACGVIKAG